MIKQTNAAEPLTPAEEWQRDHERLKPTRDPTHGGRYRARDQKKEHERRRVGTFQNVNKARPIGEMKTHEV